MKKIWVLVKAEITAHGGHWMQVEVYSNREAALKNLDRYRLKFYKAVEADRTHCYWSADDSENGFQCVMFGHRYKYCVVEDVLREE